MPLWIGMAARRMGGIIARRGFIRPRVMMAGLEGPGQRRKSVDGGILSGSAYCIQCCCTS